MIDRRMIPQLGCEISRLGYGGMRFPKNGDEVDVEEAVKLLRKAYDMGVNYFDTAVVYHKGESEKIFGKAFEIYDRSSYYLADKMSIWVCKDEQEMKDLFERQLKTLKTDYIDFYLVHSLNRNHYQKVKEFHCVEFLQEMKRQGKIKHLGFSFHDTYPVFTQIRQWISETGREIDLQVDGGVNAETAKVCVEAGANVLVAGSYLFSKPDYAAAIKTLVD